MIMVVKRWNIHLRIRARVLYRIRVQMCYIVCVCTLGRCTSTLGLYGPPMWYYAQLHRLLTLSVNFSVLDGLLMLSISLCMFAR